MKKRWITFWVVIYFFWLMFTAYTFKMDRFVHAYQDQLYYENMIQDGVKSDYIRQAYMRASKRAQETGKYPVLFLSIGIIAPWLLVLLIRRFRS